MFVIFLYEENELKIYPTNNLLSDFKNKYIKQLLPAFSYVKRILIPSSFYYKGM